MKRRAVQIAAQGDVMDPPCTLAIARHVRSLMRSAPFALISWTLILSCLLVGCAVWHAAPAEEVLEQSRPIRVTLIDGTRMEFESAYAEEEFLYGFLAEDAERTPDSADSLRAPIRLPLAQIAKLEWRDDSFLATRGERIFWPALIMGLMLIMILVPVVAGDWG